MNHTRRILCLLLTLLLLPVLPASAQLAHDRAEKLHALSLQLLEHIREGQEDEALTMMDEATAAALKGQVTALWQQLAQSGGDYLGDGYYRGVLANGYETLEMTLSFSSLSLIQRTSFDAQDRVIGLFFAPGAVTPPEFMPEAVQEVPLTVDAGTGYPLSGLLTTPKEGPILAGLVLVQGSGPSDRDEAVAANAPFRDLAWGLAGQGIAVLRYDKRTYTYGTRMAQEPDFARLTAREEVVEDAVAALNLLKGQQELADKPVYLLGHSLGAMLAAYIGQQGGDPAGYVLLGGTPRKLWELSAEQNLTMAQELEDGGDQKQAADIRAFVAAETEKGKRLADMTDEEALTTTVMGLSSWYLRDLEGVDAAQLHMADGKPLLALHGENDRQVSMTDYNLWQEQLKDHPDATFIAYPGLNHLFGAYQGEPVPFSQLVSVEYAQRTPIPRQVMDDIAGWIAKHAQ